MMNPVSIEPGWLTIGVAAYGNVEVTEQCLRAIFASVAGEFDLILVDDASPDNMLDLFREARDYHPRTRLFHFPENKEYSNSVNCILSHARTDLTLFVSNDILITPGYVRTLMEAMREPGIGIARGVSNFVDGFIDSKVHNVDIVDAVASYEDVERLASSIAAGDRAWTTPDLFLTGDAFMTRRDLVERIGGFDTALVGYFSDMDFGIRAAHAGFSRVVCGRAFAWHARDANIDYLPEVERERKVQRRRLRVDAAWKVLRRKWGMDALAEDWQATMLRAIPYHQLDRRPFVADVDVAQRQDYSMFEMP
jgi:GT2 family glycosyltransferase